MSNNVKEIDIKYQTYYFFADFIDIKNLLTYKSIFIYYIGYVTIKDWKYVEINSVNPLYLIFNKVNGYSEEINGNEYLTLVPTNENKEKIWRTVE